MTVPLDADQLERGFTPRQKAVLGFEIVVAYSRARWLLWRTDLPTTVTGLRTTSFRHAGTAQTHRAGLRLGRAIAKTLRHVPFDSRCLMRSLVLTTLLAQRGIESSLVIAVTPEDGFRAHAWVEIDGEPLLDPAGPPFSRMVEM